MEVFGLCVWCSVYGTVAQCQWPISLIRTDSLLSWKIHFHPVQRAAPLGIEPIFFSAISLLPGQRSGARSHFFGTEIMCQLCSISIRLTHPNYLFERVEPRKYANRISWFRQFSQQVKQAICFGNQLTPTLKPNEAELCNWWHSSPNSVHMSYRNVSRNSKRVDLHTDW